MALTKKTMSKFHWMTCKCLRGNTLLSGMGMTTQDILTPMTPKRSIINTIRTEDMIKDIIQDKAGNTRTILTIIGAVRAVIIGMLGILETSGTTGMTDIMLQAGQLPLTTCTGHTISTDIDEFLITDITIKILETGTP